jgi:hypothetical protein
MSTLRACYYFHLDLGYSPNTALRLALWCCDPSQELNKHHQ